MLITLQQAALLGDLTAVAMCSVAAVNDLRSYRVPNWLTFGGAGLSPA